MKGIRRSEGPERLELDLPAAHSAGREARRLAREFVLSRGVSVTECETLVFVVGELLDNAVDHGGGEGAREVADLSRDVRLSLEITLAPGRWVVTVGDQGGGDPEGMQRQLDASRERPDLEDERGRGLFLLALLVDELTVSATPSGSGLAIRAARRYGSSE